MIVGLFFDIILRRIMSSGSISSQKSPSKTGYETSYGFGDKLE
jgi:hypothetical protein